MGEFRDFIEAFTGGAFGKGENSDFSKISAADKLDITKFTDREANKYRHQQERIAMGKSMEGKIIDALREIGWEIHPPKPSQDKTDKVDGWVNEGGKWIPVQIKYRDSGDGIAMETMWGWDAARFEGPLVFDGRDMVGKAKIYICLNQSGTVIRVCSADEAKAAAQEACKELAFEFNEKGVRRLATMKAVCIISNDPASGRAKVMSFVRPNSLRSLKLIPVPGKKSLWVA